MLFYSEELKLYVKVFFEHTDLTDLWCHITFAYSQRKEKCLELTDNKIKDLLLYLLLLRKFYFKELKGLVIVVAFLLQVIYNTSPAHLIDCLRKWFDYQFTHIFLFSYS